MANGARGSDRGRSCGVDFLSVIPSCIDYAENRMYAELDLLNTVTRVSGRMAANKLDFTIPIGNGRIIVTNGINVIMPATAQTPGAGIRNQLTPVSHDFLDAVGGDPSFTGVPIHYAMIADQAIIVGPARPDAGYLLEVIGSIRPPSLDLVTTSRTCLTNFLPQLWFAATMGSAENDDKNRRRQAPAYR